MTEREGEKRSLFIYNMIKYVKNSETHMKI